MNQTNSTNSTIKYGSQTIGTIEDTKVGDLNFKNVFYVDDDYIDATSSISLDIV